MIFFIILLIIAFVVFCFTFYKTRQIVQINEQTIQENEKNLKALEETKIRIQLADAELASLTRASTQAAKDLENLSNTFKELSKKDEQTLKELFEQKKYQFEVQAEEEKNKINTSIQCFKVEAEKEYINLLAEKAKSYSQSLEEINKMQLQIKSFRQIIDSLVENNKRAQKIKEEKEFFKLKIPQEDLEEIQKLKEVSKVLRNQEPLNKVIWKVYYEKPTLDLIGRIVGAKEKIGIYKITNLSNQMCYVGQSNQIGERFKQHIKRGLGAEAATKNKLYPAMKEFGVENFSFEIIEECDLNLLNEKEQYWQEVFHAKDFGYSIK